MSTKVDLQIANPGRYQLNRERLFGVVERVLNREAREEWQKGDERIEVSLLVVNREQMATFNWQYHDTKGPTDVLSFPYTDPQSQTSTEVFVTPHGRGIILGDLIVCYPVARDEAVNQGKTVDDLLDFYVEHGLMHLLGHHHE